MMPWRLALGAWSELPTRRLSDSAYCRVMPVPSGILGGLGGSHLTMYVHIIHHITCLILRTAPSAQPSVESLYCAHVFQTLFFT